MKRNGISEKSKNIKKNTTLLGYAAEYRVMSEMLLRGKIASLVTLDDGADIITNKRERVQVRSQKATREDTVRFSYPKKKPFDILILWVRNRDLFYIFPNEVLTGNTGHHFSIRRHTKFAKYLECWDLLK